MASCRGRGPWTRRRRQAHGRSRCAVAPRAPKRCSGSNRARDPALPEDYRARGADVIEVRSVRAGDQVEWDEIAGSSDDAWLTHTWTWNEAIEERVMGGESRRLVIPVSYTHLRA